MNFASAANKAQLVHYTSATIGFPCEHVLIDDQNNQIWISEASLPQEIVIKIDSSLLNNKSVCLAGWFCHKKYIFNPRVVKMYIAKQFDPHNPQEHFVHWATMTADDVCTIELLI
jgi:hypothetical protein